MMKIHTLALAIVALILFSSSAIAKDVVLDNGTIRYTVSNSKNKIKIGSLYDIAQQQELLADSQSAPYFEFIINDAKVTSDMPLWKYAGKQQKQLLNGGTQISATYNGTGWIKGLSITIDWQYFPASPLIRERLRIRADKANKFHLSNLAEKNHFVYPQYSFRKGKETSSREVTEIRMGSYGNEILPDFDSTLTYDNRSTRNLATCHMFHTDFIKHVSNKGTDILMKGPFSVIPAGKHKIITSYEHASQDKAINHNNSQPENDPLIDASQGVKGSVDYIPTDSDYWFIGTRALNNEESYVVSQNILRGGYLHNEAIPSKEYYETVWSTLNVIPADADHLAAIKQYLLHQITEHKASRKANFYYNTWGMQRDSQWEKMDLRDIFNEKRILEEIDYAAELNVDMIVLDDGWQETMGIWTPSKAKLPNGIEPLMKKMKSHNILPGIWLSLMGIDSTTTRYREHRDWVIRDAKNKPIAAQWDHPAFDLVGGFYDLIKEDHKKMIDMGFRFFKWDAINTFNSFQPNLYHGDDSYPRKEIIDRYNYLLPIFVTRLMRELREYNPDIVIEVDLTEPERAMVGLIALQEGKLFWMNNGASGYGDYSTMRTKSMRNIINQTGALLPPEIFTYAEYPHNIAPYFAQRYNVNTTLIAGHGLWGNLKRMSQKERKKAGELVAKSKRVLPHINGKPLVYKGLIGSTPEIYQQVDFDNAFGQIIGFSGSASEYKLEIDINTSNLLGVINHAYSSSNNKLDLNLQFSMPDDTREAFVLGNEGKGISILSSTGWIDDIILRDNSLTIIPGIESALQIKLPGSGIQPDINTAYTKLSDQVISIQGEKDKAIVIKW